MIEVPNPLLATSVAKPEQAVLVVGKTEVTAAQAVTAIGKCARALQAQGVRRGAFHLLSEADPFLWWQTYHALIWLGAIPVLLEPDADPGKSRAAHRLMLSTSAQGEVANNDADVDPSHAQPWRFDAVAAYVFSSGSVSEPQPIAVTYGMVVLAGLSSTIRLGHHLDDRWLCCLPPYHVGGLSIVLRTALLGTTCILELPFDADRVSEVIDTHSVSQISLVARMLDQLMQVRQSRFPSHLRFALVGGGPCPDALVARAAQLGCQVLRTWGMTETLGQVATEVPSTDGQPVAAPRRRAPSSMLTAPAMPLYQVAQARDGTLEIAAPWQRAPVATRDRGAIDSGWVQLFGRADRIVTCGGANFDLGQIEARLAELPGEPTVFVEAIAHPSFGASICAFVASRGPREHNGADGWGTRIDAAAPPHYWVFADDIRTTALAKVPRHERSAWRGWFIDALHGSPRHRVFCGRSMPVERAAALLPAMASRITTYQHGPRRQHER